MSLPVEQDYIGASEREFSVGGGEEGALNLRATELRLGLPGSESHQRDDKVGLTLDLLPKSFASGAKRGFFDAIDNAGKWGFVAGEGGSEVNLVKGCGLLSTSGQASEQGNVGKVAVHCGGSIGRDRSAAPAAKHVLDANKREARFVYGGIFNIVYYLKVKAQLWWSKVVQVEEDEVANNVKHTPKELSKHKDEGKNSLDLLYQKVVGWPPIRSHRKNNTMATNPSKTKDDAEGKQGQNCLYVKVSMDGAPYLRKVDLKIYKNYKELSLALEKMFRCFTIGQCDSQVTPGNEGLSENRLTDLLNGSEYVLTYEDKDGDWMLVGDVPWGMFTDSCRRLRIMKSSDAIGLAPKGVKYRNHN